MSVEEYRNFLAIKNIINNLCDVFKVPRPEIINDTHLVGHRSHITPEGHIYIHADDFRDGFSPSLACDWLAEHLIYLSTHSPHREEDRARQVIATLILSWVESKKTSDGTAPEKEN